MLKYSFNMDEVYQDIENAVRSVLKDGFRTQDIMQEGMKLTGTAQIGSETARRILSC